MAYSFIDKFGYRRQRANPISRTGVFPYTGEQIDQPKKDKNGKPIFKRDDLGKIIYKRDQKTGMLKLDKDGDPIPEYEMQFGLEPEKLYPVLRGPEALFEAQAIESFNGLPIRVGHLMIGDEKKNNKDEKDKRLSSADKNPNDGCIYNVRPSLDEPGYLIADFCIYTDRMKDILKEGKVKELSLGYTCVYEPEEGIFDGIPYMFKQTKLRGNHLALVKHGRCGSSVCVYDEAVVTFDSLPESLVSHEEKETPMEDNKKEETEKLDRAKALASAIKKGDEQLAQDCLDFADFPPEVRKEALERCKAGKCEKKDGEKEVSDKAPKAAKDGAEVPVPPELPQGEEKKEDKPAESNAPAASTASAPAPAAEPEPTDAPAGQDVPSPKNGEEPTPAKDKACKDKAPAQEAHVCDKCGCNPCKCEKKEDVPAKDCGDKAPKSCEDKGCADKGCEDKGCEDKAAKDGAPAQPVTEPTAQTPVAALQTPKEEKKEDKPTEKPEDKPVGDKACKDKEPEQVTIVKKKEEKPGEAIAEVIEGKETTDGAEKRIKADVVAEHDNVPPGKTAKVAQDEYAAFVAEYSEAQSLAGKLRPYIKETFDSAPMRVIDVARFAAKHIDTLAFVMDEADDEKVLTAVRGYAAAVAMDQAPKKPEVLEDAIPNADVIVQDAAPETPAPVANSKDLLAFLSE